MRFCSPFSVSHRYFFRLSTVRWCQTCSSNLFSVGGLGQMPGSKGFMFKTELQTEAQPLCDKSFTVVSRTSPHVFASMTSYCVCVCVCVQPDLGSKYTAWSSVSTLIQKNLLLKTHNPARYVVQEGAQAA